MYNIVFSQQAKKSLSQLDKSIQTKIVGYLGRKSLLKDPKSFGKVLLSKRKGSWRYRVGDYRIICKILGDDLIVLVIDVGHRKIIYDK